MHDGSLNPDIVNCGVNLVIHSIDELKVACWPVDGKVKKESGVGDQLSSGPVASEQTGTR